MSDHLEKGFGRLLSEFLLWVLGIFLPLYLADWVIHWAQDATAVPGVEIGGWVFLRIPILGFIGYLFLHFTPESRSYLRFFQKFYRELVILGLCTLPVWFAFKEVGDVHRLVRLFMDGMWKYVVFLPVLVLLDKEIGAVGSLKRAWGLIRRQWGNLVYFVLFYALALLSLEVLYYLSLYVGGIFRIFRWAMLQIITMGFFLTLGSFYEYESLMEEKEEGI